MQNVNILINKCIIIYIHFKQVTDPEHNSNSSSTGYDYTDTSQDLPPQDTIPSFSFLSDVCPMQHHLSLIQHSHKCLEAQF